MPLRLSPWALRWALSAAMMMPGVCAQVATPPAPGLTSPARGLSLFLAGFQPSPAETSLLAEARRRGLTWAQTQQLFAARVTDEGQRFLDWRGVAALPAGLVFTTVRAATYLTGGRTLFVLNREWCQQGQCETRTTFAWQTAAALEVLPEAALIPLIRDRDFFSGPLPACLQGVSLGVQYVPSRRLAALSALPIIPPAVRRTCEAARVNIGTVTRPVTLTWASSAGRFRR